MLFSPLPCFRAFRVAIVALSAGNNRDLHIRKFPLKLFHDALAALADMLLRKNDDLRRINQLPGELIRGVLEKLRLRAA